MPLFEYNCPNCKNSFEQLVFADDTPECPKCGNQQLEKQLSVFAAISSSSALPVCQGGSGPLPCTQGLCQDGKCVLDG